MRYLIIYILVLSSCSSLKIKNEPYLYYAHEGSFVRFKYVKCSSSEDYKGDFERIDTIQIIRKYLSDNIFIQTDFQAYFPLKGDLSFNDTIFIDTFMQNGDVWYTIENQKPILYFNKDSIQLGEYGHPYDNSPTFYLKDKYLDTSNYNGEFVAKIRWSVYSTSKFSGSSVFEEGNLFCFSPYLGWVTGYPYYDDSQIYRLIQIETLLKKNKFKINIDLKGLDKWMLE